MTRTSAKQPAHAEPARTDQHQKHHETEDEIYYFETLARLCCHPDKSTHPDAPRAFEVLKKAKAVLSNELDRDDYLLNFVKQQRVNWEGNWATAQVAGEAKQRVTAMRQEAQRREQQIMREQQLRREQQMRQEGVKPNEFVYAGLMEACVVARQPAVAICTTSSPWSSSSTICATSAAVQQAVCSCCPQIEPASVGLCVGAPADCRSAQVPSR